MQIPVDIPNHIESQAPLSYDILCRMTGELYIESYLKVKTLHEDAQNAITQLQQSLTDAKNELSVVKKKLADLEGK